MEFGVRGEFFGYQILVRKLGGPKVNGPKVKRPISESGRYIK